MGLDWKRLKRHRGDQARPVRTGKKSEMLEVRVSLPLKQALDAHCQITGVQRSAFVRGAIEARMARERKALEGGLMAGTNLAGMVSVSARAAGVFGLILMAGYWSAVAVRPDASAMLPMAQMAHMTQSAHPASSE